MVSVYSLNCSVCKGEYSSKSEWLQHLTSKAHQKLARKDCLEKWKSPVMRECCLVVYSSFLLTEPRYSGGGAGKVIQHFSKHPATFVTDFVSWEDRPRIGVVQFESKQKTEDTFNNSLEQLIDNQRVQVRRAVDLLDLEWSSMLPDALSSNSSSEMRLACSMPDMVAKMEVSPSTQIPHTFPITEKKPNTNWMSDPDRKRHQVSANGDANTPKKLKVLEQQECPIVTNFTNTPSLSLPVTSLQDQYADIIKSVTIPDSEYESATKIVSTLQRLFRFHDVAAEVKLFRNWFLKLRNPVYIGNVMILFVYISRPPKSLPLSFTCLRPSVIGQIFHMPDSIKQFEILESADRKNKLTNDIIKPPKEVWKINHKPSGTNFRLVSLQCFMAEVQVCRLVEYMCTFDPRCHPLITLTCAWASGNSIQFGKSNLKQRINCKDLPEPHTLQWLVIFFLCHRKLIPTPREIQARQHKILKERHLGTDVGFHADMKFAQEWKSTRTNNSEDEDAFILSVLQLFQEFLQFCGTTLYNGKWILNTRDCELINTEEFLTWMKSKSIISCPPWATKMTEEELTTLGSFKPKVLLNRIGRSKKQRQLTGSDGDYEDQNLYIVHPFIFAWKLSLSMNIRSVLKMMAVTGKELEIFLNVVRSNRIGSGEQGGGTLDKIFFHG